MNKKTKVLFLGKNPPPYYGVSVWFDQLQRAQWPEEFEMLWFHNGIHTDISTLGKVGLGASFKHIRLHFRFLRFLIRHKPDIIIIPISQSFVGFVKDSVYILISALFRGKTLVILHGSNIKNWLNQSHRLVRSYFRFAMKRCFGAIVLSEKLKYIFLEYFPSDRIYSVPNGLNFNKQFPKTHAINTPVLCYLGNLYMSKGVEDILNALVLVAQKKVDYRMNFIGGWGDEATKKFCLQLVEKHKLNVEFVGIKTGDEKYEILSNSDVFLFTPNKPEGLPYVVIEALALGLPVIATNQGAITDAVDHNVNGFIVESGNPESIANAVIKLIQDTQLRNTMAVNSKRIFKEYFTEKRMVDKFAEIFKRVYT